MERQFHQVAGECPACKASFVVSPGEYPAVASRNNSFAVTPTGQLAELDQAAELSRKVLNAPKIKKASFFTSGIVGGIVGMILLGLLRAKGIYLGGIAAGVVVVIFSLIGNGIGDALKKK
jgi:predicted lipid-binding transport protein (Tim44 family)